jgi:hypothetical protein
MRTGTLLDWILATSALSFPVPCIYPMARSTVPWTCCGFGRGFEVGSSATASREKQRPRTKTTNHDVRATDRSCFEEGMVSSPPLSNFQVIDQDVPTVRFVEGDPFIGESDCVPAVAAQARRGVRELQGQPPSTAAGIGGYRH